MSSPCQLHCVKSVRICSYSGLYFPAFGLNTETYFVSLRIQFDCGTIRTRITPNTGTFYAVLLCEVKFIFVEFMFIQEKIKFSFIQSFIHSLLGFRTYYTYLQLFSSVTEKKLLQEIL